MSLDAYVDALQGVIPPGEALPRDADAALTKVLRAIADEFIAIEQRAEQLLNETDPRTVSELFGEMANAYGLPDSCVTEEQSPEQLRAALVARVIARGGQNATYFIALAESLGYPGATVTEYEPATCTEPCDVPLLDDDWRYVWDLNLSQSTAIFTATCTDPCDAPLRSWGNDALECLIERLKPAGTYVHFNYGV